MSQNHDNPQEKNVDSDKIINLYKLLPCPPDKQKKSRLKENFRLQTYSVSSTGELLNDQSSMRNSHSERDFMPHSKPVATNIAQDTDQISKSVKEWIPFTNEDQSNDFKNFQNDEDTLGDDEMFIEEDKAGLLDPNKLIFNKENLIINRDQFQNSSSSHEFSNDSDSDSSVETFDQKEKPQDLVDYQQILSIRSSSESDDSETNQMKTFSKKKWLLSSIQFKYYLELFRSLLVTQLKKYGVDNTQSIDSLPISSEIVLEFFRKSHLPKSELKFIFSLSDCNLDERLNLVEFVTAMHLTVLRKEGIELPSSVPDHFLTLLKNFRDNHENSPLPKQKSNYSQFMMERNLRSSSSDSSVSSSSSCSSNSLMSSAVSTNDIVSCSESLSPDQIGLKKDNFSRKSNSNIGRYQKYRKSSKTGSTVTPKYLSFENSPPKNPPELPPRLIKRSDTIIGPPETLPPFSDVNTLPKSITKDFQIKQKPSHVEKKVLRQKMRALRHRNHVLLRLNNELLLEQQEIQGQCQNLAFRLDYLITGNG